MHFAQVNDMNKVGLVLALIVVATLAMLGRVLLRQHSLRSTLADSPLSPAASLEFDRSVTSLPVATNILDSLEALSHFCASLTALGYQKQYERSYVKLATSVGEVEHLFGVTRSAWTPMSDNGASIDPKEVTFSVQHSLGKCYVTIPNANTVQWEQKDRPERWIPPTDAVANVTFVIGTAASRAPDR